MILGPDSLVSGVVTNTDGASTQILPAPGAGLKNYVTEIYIINTSASAVTVNIQNGSGGTTRWTVSIPANSASPPISFLHGLGGFGTNTGVFFQSSAAVSSLIVAVNGFKRPN